MMDEKSRDEEASPQLLDLIPKDREWHMSREEGRSHKSSEERELELRLGPPGEAWNLNDNIKKVNRERDESHSPLSLRYFSIFPTTTRNTKNGCQIQKTSTSDNPAGAILASPWASTCYHQGKSQHNQHHHAKASSFLQFPSSPQSMPVTGKDASQPCRPKVIDLQNAEKKASSPSANTAVPNSSQKRTAPGPVVGWPPIRSFRKNLAASGSSSKPPPESQHHQRVVPDNDACKKPIGNSGKGLFVKINMDGVPIGRKVDINAYDSYEKLSSAVDELFRALLAAQRDSSAGGIHNKQNEEKAISGLLDGSGEYTLVYEDNEGDRMLVGDVPWHMFVSTVKRLRVLKSSDLSAFTLGSTQDKIPLDSAMK